MKTKCIFTRNITKAERENKLLCEVPIAIVNEKIISDRMPPMDALK